MLRPVHENTALRDRAGKASSKTHGFLFPGNRISVFFPVANRAPLPWRGECQELSVGQHRGLCSGSGLPRGTGEGSEIAGIAPRPRASRVPEAVMLALS